MPKPTRKPLHITQAKHLLPHEVLQTVIDHTDTFSKHHGISEPSINGITGPLIELKVMLDAIKASLPTFDILKHNIPMQIEINGETKTVHIITFFTMALEGDINIAQIRLGHNQIMISALANTLDYFRQNPNQITNFDFALRTYANRRIIANRIQNTNGYEFKYDIARKYLSKFRTPKNSRIIDEKLEKLDNYFRTNSEKRANLISQIKTYLTSSKPITINTIDEIIRATEEISKHQGTTQSRIPIIINSSDDHSNAKAFDVDAEFIPVINQLPEPIRIELKEYELDQKLMFLLHLNTATKTKRLDLFWQNVNAYYSQPKRLINILNALFH